MNRKITIGLLIGVLLAGLGWVVAHRLERDRLMSAVSETKDILTAITLYTLDDDDVPLPADLETLFDELDLKELRRLSAKYDFLAPGAAFSELAAGTPVIRRKEPVNGRIILGYAGGQVRPERIPAVSDPSPGR